MISKCVIERNEFERSAPQQVGAAGKAEMVGGRREGGSDGGGVTLRATALLQMNYS